MAQASARCIPHLLFENGCGHNQASYNCKHSDALSNSNDVHRWVRPIAGKMSAQTSLLDIFLKKLHGKAEIMEKFTNKI